MARLFLYSLMLGMILSQVLLANVTSSTGEIKYDINADNVPEATLNSTGLAIGSNLSPSANLHVSGNAIIGSAIVVGSSAQSSSNLKIHGSYSQSHELISSDSNIRHHSIVLVDTSSDNITLTLPDSEDMPGRQYTIKKISRSNNVTIAGGGTIDGDYSIQLADDFMGYATLISSGTQQWSIMNISGNGEGMLTVAQDNLIGWWRFDETSGTTVYDSSGRGNNGTIINMDSGNVGVEGKIGYALSFDGINDYVSVPNSDDFDVDSISIFTWVKTTDTQVTIVDRDNSSSARQFQFRMFSGKIQFISFMGGGVDGDNIGATSVNDGEWHFVGVTYDAVSGAMNVWVDGESDYSEMETPAVLDKENSPLQIGIHGNLTNYPFDGLIDDVRIYNKALSPSEVQTLYKMRQ